MRVGNALTPQPIDNLPIGNHFGSGLLRQHDRIGQVIGVGVGDQNKICCDFIDFDGCRQGVRRDEGIEKKARAAAFNEKTGVAEIGEFHSRFRK